MVHARACTLTTKRKDVILAAAWEAGCRRRLSEDMHDGFTWGGVTIVNPFAASPNKLLADLTGGTH